MPLMCFLVNSNAEKKMALTTQDRLMDTPSPMLQLGNGGYGGRRGHTTIHPGIEELDTGTSDLLPSTD
jgi:hypothetical protein